MLMPICKIRMVDATVDVDVLAGPDVHCRCGSDECNWRDKRVFSRYPYREWNIVGCLSKIDAQCSIQVK